MTLPQPSPAPAPRTVVRISRPDEVVAAVPFLVGFHPRRSVVVLVLRQARIVLTARMDLPPPGSAKPWAAHLVRRLRRGEDARVIVVYYPGPRGPGEPALLAAHPALARALDEAGLGIDAVLCVGADRWWRLEGPASESVRAEPADGEPLPDQAALPSVLSAAMVAEGRQVAASREELTRSLAPVTGSPARSMRRALGAATRDAAERLRAGSAAAVRGEGLGAWRAAAARVGTPNAALGDDDVARLVVALGDVRIRDEVIMWATGEPGWAMRPLLTEVARRAVAPYRAVPLTVLGWIAYQQGDGAFAGIACEQALAADPDYALAHLLDQALTAGLDPKLFEPVRAAVLAAIDDEAGGTAAAG